MKLIPLLHSFNPDIIQTLCTTAEILRDEERYFEIFVTKTLMKMISRKTDQRIELFASPFDAMDKVLIRRVLRRAIDETKGLKGIGFTHIEDIIRLIKTGHPGDRIYLPKGIRIIKEYSTLVLTSDPPVKMKTYTLSVPGKTILKEAGLVITASEIMKREPEHDIQTDTARSSKTFALIDAEKAQLPLTARRREDGDFFFPAGFGKRKKLQDFFVDEKVPRDERDRIPLITSGNDIIWVVGYRGDDRFMVTDSTKTVLRLEIGKLRD
jgi:tRNA(Ile)-lysidine synthase